MASSSSTTIVSSIVLFVLLSVSTADENFIRTLCKDSLHVSMCVSTLDSDPRAVACATKACVAHVGVEHSIRNVSDTRGEALKILNNSPPPAAVEALHRCTDAYANALSYLNSALGFLNDQNFAQAEATMGKAQTEAGLCEPAFPAHPNPMTQWNTLCDDMLDIAFELVDQTNS